MGGAIFVMSPDFKNNKQSKPYIYIRDNNFVQNMAYFAGNALYVTHTVDRNEPYVDYLNMCGSGVDVQGNLF